MDEISNLYNLEDEIIKLFCLVSCAKTTFQQGKEDFLSKSYLKEKISNIIKKKPIIMDINSEKMFNMIKKEKNVNKYTIT